MSQFVNYNKRDCALPAGCKNLIEVLTPGNSPKIKDDPHVTPGLAQIGHYTFMLLQPSREFSYLAITSQQLNFTVRLHRIKAEPFAAISFVNEDARREQAIRAFFQQRDTHLCLEQKQPNSDVAAGSGILMYPLPSDAPGVIKLTTELLQRVYGVSETAELGFYCYED